MIVKTSHCVKSVQVRSFFWSIFSCIRTEYGDLRSKSFRAVPVLLTFIGQKGEKSMKILVLIIEYLC